MAWSSAWNGPSLAGVNSINVNLAATSSNYYIFLCGRLYNHGETCPVGLDATHRLLLNDNHCFSFMLIGSDAILAPKPAQMRTTHQNPFVNKFAMPCTKLMYNFMLKPN